MIRKCGIRMYIEITGKTAAEYCNGEAFQQS